MPIRITGYPERMPNRWRFLTIAVSLVFITGLLLTTANRASAEGDVARITFPVEGMVCPFCEASVENLLGKMGGVVAVEASAAAGTVQVEYQPAAVSPEQLVEAINTNTFYRARLPGTEASTSATTITPPNRLPWLLGGIFILIGFIAWWAIAQRHADRATRAATQHTPQEVGEHAS